LAATAAGGGGRRALEPGMLEELDSPDVARDDVDAVATSIHWVALDDLGAVGRCVLQGAGQ
jgi:hypothetical protein